MQIIDLTQDLFDKMPVYPGDPEVSIKEIHKLNKEGWNLRQITFTTHIGTHVNAPYHMIEDGKTLDDLPLTHFFGKSILYSSGHKFSTDIGVIFSKTNINESIAKSLIEIPPKFVGLSAEFEFDIALEKMLLKHGIVSFENLVNTDKLPESFMFYGVPLKLKGADGSPVRAFAVI